MTLSEIRTYVRELLHDPNGDHITDARANRAINNAYRELVNEVDSTSSVLNLYGQAFQVSWGVVPAPPRDVELAFDDFTIQPILEVRRPVVVWCTWWAAGPVTLGETYIPILPFVEFDRVRGTKLYGLVQPPFAVTFFRTTEDPGDKWYVRFVGSHPMAVTIFDTPIFAASMKVWVLREIDELSADEDVPIQVPEQWHRVLATQAALLGGMSTGREIQSLAALVVEGLARMRRQLATVAHVRKPDGFLTPKVNHGSAA